MSVPLQTILSLTIRATFSMTSLTSGYVQGTSAARLLVGLLVLRERLNKRTLHWSQNARMHEPMQMEVQLVPRTPLHGVLDVLFGSFFCSFHTVVTLQAFSAAHGHETGQDSYHHMCILCLKAHMN